MGEIPSNHQSEQRQRVPEELLDEPITHDQWRVFIQSIYCKITDPMESVTVNHAHRARRSTDIRTASTIYDPPGHLVECSVNENMLVLKTVTSTPYEDGVDRVTERYFEVSPKSREDDFYDEIPRLVDTESGKTIQGPPQPTLIPESLDEVFALQAKLDANLLTQGRWQEAMDILDMCTDYNRITVPSYLPTSQSN